MRSAVIIRTDDTVEQVDIDDGNVLGQFQSAVGGYIEGVDLQEVFLYVNEEGKMNGLPVNRIATALFHAIYGPHDIIVGDVVAVGPADDEGEDGSLTGLQLAALFDRLVKENA